MTVNDVLEKFNELAPFDSALSWDNVGLLVGKRNAIVKKVYVTLDVSEHALDEAIHLGCDLIVTHHPMIFKSLPRICDDDFLGRYVLRMVESNINYIAMHTNFDVHVMGALVAKRLKLSDAEVFEVTAVDEKEFGIGTISNLETPISLKQLAENVKELFDLPHLTYYGRDDAIIKRVAVVPGSGKDEVGLAIKRKADVLISGDITHHTGIDALSAGLCVINAGHYGLEHIFTEYMNNYIKTTFNINEVYSENTEFPEKMI